MIQALSEVTILNMLVLSFLLALILSAGDEISTWWFMQPAKQLNRNPIQYERNPLPKFLMMHLGIGPGLILSGLIEVFLFTILLGFVDVFSASLPLYNVWVVFAATANVVAVFLFSYCVVWNNLKVGRVLRLKVLSSPTHS